MNCVAIGRNVGCKLFDADDLDLAFQPVYAPLPETWQQAFGQPRIRALFVNHADLLIGVEQSDDRRIFVLDMYCLHYLPCGRRTTSIRGLEQDVILRAVRASWSEFVDVNHMVVNFVFPQPEWLDVTKIVLIVEFFAPGHDFEHAIAILIEDMNPRQQHNQEHRMPIYVEARMTVREILRKVELDYECQPLGFRYCVIKTLHGVAEEAEEWRAYRGAFVEIHKHDLSTVPVDECMLLHGIVQLAGHFEVQQRRLQGSSTVELRTHATDEVGRPMGMRRMYINMADLLNPRQVWLWIYDLWRDHVQERLPRVLAVEHQPIQPQSSDQVVGHVLVRLDSSDSMMPVLCTITASFQSDVVVHPVGLQALLLPQFVTVHEILRRLGFDDFVREMTSHHYVRQGFRELMEENQRYEVVKAGNYFIHLTLGRFDAFFQSVLHRNEGFTGSLLFGTDGDMRQLSDTEQTDDEAGDDVNMMQQRLHHEIAGDELNMMQAPGQQRARKSIVFFVGLGRTHARLEVDPSVAIMDELEAHWPFNPRRPDEIHGLHLVTSPPTIGEDPEVPQPEMYILEYTDDYFQQVHPDDCMMLCTIVFKGPDEWTHRIQKVMWGPVRASRTHMLLFLRLSWFCRRPSVICWLYLDGISWIQEPPPHEINNGAHVRVTIRSDRERWNEVQYAETNERQRRVCVSSESEEEQQNVHQEEEEEEEEEVSVVSRSRSRSTIRNHASDDSSLLQQGLVLHMPSTAQARVNFLQRGKSHVLDRWCTQPFAVCCGIGTVVRSVIRKIDEKRSWQWDYGFELLRAGLCNEFAVVLYLAFMILAGIVRRDLCKCRCKRMCKVGDVRHQRVKRKTCTTKLIAHFLLYLVIAQHCMVTTQAIQREAIGRQQKRDSDFFYSTFRNLPPPGNGAPCVIQLNDLISNDSIGQRTEHLPADDHQDIDLAIDVPEMLLTSLTELMHGPLRSMTTDELDRHNFHDSTKQTWKEWGPHEAIGEGVQAVHIYTDGSAGQYYADYEYHHSATWAFGVWLQTSEGYALLAADSGHVGLDPQDRFWTGAKWGSAAEGERAALLSGAVYATRLNAECPVYFWFDSVTAGFGASGRWAHNANSCDAVLTRCAFQLLEARNHGAVLYQHVKAHQGDPYNEFVNTLAYEALNRQKQRTVLDFEVLELIQGDKPLCAHWVTIYLASLGRSQYPGLDYGRIVWTRNQAGPHSEIVWRDFIQGEVGGEAPEGQMLTIISYNVRTLQSQPGDCEVNSAVGAYALLEAQLFDRQIDVAFLQETRARNSYTLKGPHYTRFVAGASEGHGGTEIWIANCPLQARGLQLSRGKNHIALLQESERLIVRLELPIGPVLLVSAHGPHSSHGQDVVRSWWEDLTHKIKHFAGDGHILLGIDANAHFAQTHADAIGSCGLEDRENSAAPLFAQLLELCGCWLPATFPQCHFGPTNSWRHPGRGTWHRCDYIAISRSLPTDGVQSWIDGNIDAGGANVDHLAVVLRISVPKPQKPEVKGSVLGSNIDVKAIVQSADADIEKIFNGLVPIDWESNVHDHGAVFVRQLRQQLEHHFRKPRRRPNKSFISEIAWNIRADRRHVRRQMYHRRQVGQTSDVGAALRAWKEQRLFGDILRKGRKWDLLQILADMKDRLQLRRLGHELRQQLRKDKERYCTEVAAEAETLPASMVVRKLRCIGFRSKRTPAKVRPLDAMLNAEDKPCLSVDEVNLLWQRFFEEMEDGEEVTHETLLSRCERQQRSTTPPVPRLEELTTLLDLETALRQNQYSKASYFDGIPSDLGRRFPHLLARAFLHLVWKQQLLVQEPITFKGGILIQAYKGRGAPSRCENFRALMVSSILAKAAHRSLRNSAMQTFASYRLPLQIGGLAGRSVAQGAHCLLSYAAMCRRTGQSYAILFVDIKQAFYRLLREHIVNIELSDAAVQKLFATLNLPPSSFADFAKELEQDAAMETARTSPFVCAHVQEALQGTWFKLMGSERISQTKRGSRPGDNMADLLFAFAFRRILGKVLEQLEVEGCSMEVESLGVAHPYPDQLGMYPLVRFSTLGPIWADDLAVMVSERSAKDLVNKLKYVGGVLFQHLERAGMQVNFDAGKTEIVLDLRGAGATALRKELFRHRPPVMEFAGPLQTTRFCRLVATYKHLGTIFSHKGRMLPEIRSRVGQAKQAFRKHRKLIFGNDRLPVKTRTQLFVSLVMSVLQFNIAIWPPLSNNEHQAFSCGVQSLYHSLAFAMWGPIVFDWRVEKVADALGLSQADVVLRNARLRYFQHLTLKADEFVWAFVHLDTDWLGLIRADLAWMCGQIPFAVPQTTPDYDWEVWEAMVRHKSRWKKLVTRACAHADGQRALRSHWHEGHKRILDVLKEINLWKDETRKIDLGVHACLRCQKRFKSKAAWSVHAFRAHQRVAATRRLAHGLTCLVCHRVYALHSRLVNHLRYSTACAEELRRRGLTVDAQPSIGSKTEQKARFKALAPVLRADGPDLPGLGQPVPEDLLDQGKEQLCERMLDVIEECAHRPGQVDVMILQMWRAFQTSVIHPDDIQPLLRQCVNAYRNDFDMDDVEDYTTSQRLDELMTAIADNWSLQWLCGHIPQDHVAQATGKGELDAEEEIDKLVRARLQHSVVLRPIKLRCLILLHLFSGHRRHGDVQDSFEKLSGQACFPHYGLSVDVVISLEWGNLLKDEVRNFFLRAIRESQIVSTIAGPPCETWSKAREEFYRNQKGPRPVRTRASPWGMACLRLRELAQVKIGNLLLFVALQFAYVSWCAGAMMVLEHPAEPSSDYSVSIWRLGVVRFLIQQPGVVKWRLFQGHFGSPSPKPTDLLLVHPPDNFRELLERCKSTQQLPKETSIGCTDGGVFKTQRLKEYPVPLCRALALLSFTHGMTRGHSMDCCEPSPNMGDMLRSLRSEVGEGSLGPDFCANAAQAT